MKTLKEWIDIIQERGFLLQALYGMLKGDWTHLLVYSDWLQDNNDFFGEYIQYIYKRIQNRQDKETKEEWKRYQFLGNWVYDNTIKGIKDWYFMSGYNNNEWVNSKENITISVYRLKFELVKPGFGNDEKLSWEDVPTELLKAGLAKHLEYNYHFDSPINNNS